jgi:hypothetical protein
MGFSLSLGVVFALFACSLPSAKYRPLGDGPSVTEDAAVDAREIDARELDAAVGPAVTSVDQPARIATSDTVTIKVMLHGVHPGSVTWTVAATNGMFTPTAGTTDLDTNGNGTFNVSYKASATAGDDAWSVALDDGTTTHTSFVAKVGALVAIGETTTFADHLNMTVSANNLYGQQVTVASQTYLMRFGLFSDNTGVNARVALYLDNGANPATLVAQTASQALVIGRNEMRLAAPMQINAGTYWLMADFDAGAQVRRGSTNVAQMYVSVASTVPLPTTTAGATTLTGSSLNYFAEVIP